jgi:glycosyltransferase involved in cell wall biosynthesis
MKRKIKLTYMIDVLCTNLAGTENQLIKMIKGMDRDRFDVELVCFRDDPWFQANKASLNCVTKVFPISMFKSPGTYLNILKLAGYLRSSRPDVVHTFFPVSNIVGVLASRLAAVKVIISSRRDYGEWMTPRYLFVTKLANRFVTRIIANSNAVKELTVEKENAGCDRVGVIYNGIDSSFGTNLARDKALKRRLNIPDSDLVVGIVANFRPMKHHHTFVRAAAEVLKNRTDVTFILIGTGGLREEAEKLAEELGIREKLLFLGPQREILPYISIMDAGVNCSEGEGLSNAVMEYMSAGVPCVVSQAGGNPDLIQDGVNGYTFAIDDYKALASCMLRLFEDAGVRAAFTAAARRKIENEMSLGVIISKYEELYAALAAG